MNAQELQRIAGDLIPPAGTTQACALVETEPGEAIRYRAAFLVDGRVKVAAGPVLDHPRDVYRLVDILNGTVRPKPDPIVVEGAAPAATPPRIAAECHPDRPHKAKGLCKPCWARSRRSTSIEARP